MMTRSFFTAALGTALLGLGQRAAAIRVATYRDRGCGCCEGWVRAARDAGYAVDLHELDRPDRLRRFGLTDETAGCHTSLVGGYLVEGHVPFAVVARLLRERPAIRGITIPGMPLDVPGMPGHRSGSLTVFTLEPHPRVYALVD